MIHGERPQRSLHWDAKGLTGRLEVLVDWSEVDPTLNWVLPHVGDPWLGIPFLRCVDVQMDEEDAGLCRYVVQYSTDRRLGENFYEASFGMSVEVVDITEGRTWADALTPITVSVPTQIATANYNITIKLAGTDWLLGTAPPKDQLIAAANKVNDRKFHGFLAGHLRFDGADTSEAYDLDGNPISVNVTYKFVYRERKHNEIWRPALQMRDLDGNLVYYQNIDAGESYYTTDQSLIATPVYVEGTAGTSGWDEPTVGRYDECNFAAVLGLPIQFGDDVP